VRLVRRLASIAVLGLAASTCSSGRPEREAAVAETRAQAGRPVLVDLASIVSGRARVQDVESKTTLTFTLAGSHDVSARLAPEGVEDFVRFARDPAVESLEYRVDLERVAGLRLVENVLELLDAGGAPRLRVGRPYVVDARGARSSARLEVEGCAVDRDAAAPWGRPVVAPGASVCLVRVRWGRAVGADVAYPAVVDPAWTATKSMIDQHYDAAALVLPSQHVLVAAGETNASELYDPSSHTWAVSGNLTASRSFFGMVMLGNGKILAAGGFLSGNNPDATAELYDPATGTWTGTGRMSNGRYCPLVVLQSGKVLAAGGASDASADVYDPATGGWTPTGPMSVTRMNNSANLLPTDGKVIVAGGNDITGYNWYNDSEIYDPTTNTWSAGPTLLDTRLGHLGVTLKDGRVMIFGGQDGIGHVASAEIYDAGQNTWSAAASMAWARENHAVSMLPNGNLLVTGGEIPPFFQEQQQVVFLDSTELYDPKADKWVSTGLLAAPRAEHIQVSLPNGDALVAGGVPSAQTAVSAEVFQVQSAGTCTAGAECSSGFCVDGVCCNSACNTPCSACSAALKGGGADGTCGPAAAKTDPHKDCPTLPASTCGASGVCDGAGACALYAMGTSCGTPRCAAGSLQSPACDGKGTCANQATSCSPYVCKDGTSCAHSPCAGPSDCQPGLWCSPGTHACGPPGPSCDGDHTIYHPDGTKTDCSPYGCGSSGCKTQCNSALDCASGDACERDHVCAPTANGETVTESGFGCALGEPRSAGHGSAAAFAALAALASLRRRRSQNT
jgi:hypothetical protein